MVGAVVVARTLLHITNDHLRELARGAADDQAVETIGLEPGTFVLAQ